MQDLEESINITVDGDERIFGCTAGISYFSGNKALGKKARNQVKQIERRFGEFQSAYSLGNAIDKADKQVNERKKTNGRSKR